MTKTCHKDTVSHHGSREAVNISKTQEANRAGETDSLRKQEAQQREKVPSLIPAAQRARGSSKNAEILRCVGFGTIDDRVDAGVNIDMQSMLQEIIDREEWVMVELQNTSADN